MSDRPRLTDKPSTGRKAKAGDLPAGQWAPELADAELDGVPPRAVSHGWGTLPGPQNWRAW